jgi:hypothetical protein
LQSGFTRFCPLDMILKRLGVKEVEACDTPPRREPLGFTR